MHASNVQVYAIDSIMEGVNQSKKKKKMKIKRRHKRKKRRIAKPGKGPPSTVNESPDGATWSDAKSVGSVSPNVSPRPEPSPTPDAAIDMSEEKEFPQNPEGSPAAGPESEEKETSLKVSDNNIIPAVEENLTLPSGSLVPTSQAKVELDTAYEENEVPLPMITEDNLPPGEGNTEPKASEVSSPPQDTQEQKALDSNVQEEKTSGTIGDEKISHGFLVIPESPRTAPQQDEDKPTETLVIAEEGGEQFIKVPSTIDEATALNDQELPQIGIENNVGGTNEEHADKISPLPVRAVNKLSKDRTEGIFGNSKPAPEHQTSAAARLADLGKREEYYSDEQIVKSGEKLDDLSTLELDFAHKAEQISAAFSVGDLSSLKTITGDELNGVQHKRLVSNMDIDFTDTQITRHFTEEEMALLEGVDASKRKEAIMRMMSAGFKKNTSVDLRDVDVSKIRNRQESYIQKSKESPTKKNSKKNLGVKVDVARRKSKYLANLEENQAKAKSKQRIRRPSSGDSKKFRSAAQLKYMRSVQRLDSTSTSSTSSTLKRKKSNTLVSNPALLKRKSTSSRPRLNAKRESWRKNGTEQKSSDLLRMRSLTFTEGKNSEPGNRRNTYTSPRKETKERLKSSEIEEAKMRAARGLSYKPEYPYGPHAAKMMEERESQRNLLKEKDTQALHEMLSESSVIPEDEVDE